MDSNVLKDAADDDVKLSTNSASISDCDRQLASMEFRTILISISPAAAKNIRLQSDTSGTYTDSDYSSWYSQDWINKNSDAISVEAIENLRAIAEQMIASGYTAQCIEMYTSVRKARTEEMLNLLLRLGIDRLGSESIQTWLIQKEKIQIWIRASEAYVRSLLPGEKALADRIFRGFGIHNIIADHCFMKTVEDSAVQLFNFVEAISNSRGPPEKLFKILKVYDVLSDLLPEIDDIFGSKSGEFIRKKAVKIRCSLAEAAREMLTEFEKDVLGDLDPLPIHEGALHPSTRYVMNYLSSMMNYKPILIELIVSKPFTHSSELDLDMSEFEGEASPLALHLVSITKTLKFNLKNKSKKYKDAALAYFFMMNNVYYMVQEIRGTIELKEMMGDDYVNKLTDECNSAATNYLKISWNRVLNCLRDDDLQKLLRSLFSGSVLKMVSRQRFKGFNAKFEEVLTTQASWSVADSLVGDQLRNTILQMIIPLYASFLETHKSHIESEKHPENYIKYSLEGLERAIMGMFLEDPYLDCRRVTSWPNVSVDL